MNVYLANEQATVELAAAVAAALPDEIAGWTILLEGELGAGKSTFARALIRALGHEGSVPSPTYTLVEPYELTRGEVIHADLYRVGSPDELHYLGWSDFERSCRIIEWPDRAPGLVERADLHLFLGYRDEGRQAVLTALSPRAEDVVAAVSSTPNT